MAEYQAFNIRLPLDLYEWLRDQAYQEHRPMTEFVREALELIRQLNLEEKANA